MLAFGKLDGVSEVIDLRREHTIATFLNTS